MYNLEYFLTNINKLNNNYHEGSYGYVFTDNNYAYKISKNKTKFNDILAEGLLYKLLAENNIGPTYYATIILNNIKQN